MNSAPFELIAGPFAAWKAPVGTAEPNLGTAPAAPWVLIGASGAINYDRGEGVMVTHRKSVNAFRGSGSPYPVKNFVNEADALIEFSVADMTLEAYAIAVNDNEITETPAAVGPPAVPAHKTLDLTMGNSIATSALLLRSEESPYQAEGRSQYMYPRVQEIGSAQVERGKAGAPGKLKYQFSALIDPTGATPSIGTLKAQDASVV